MYIISLTGVDRKLNIFIAYYDKLIHLNFKALCPHLVTAKIISIEDSNTVQHTIESSEAVLKKIYSSLQGGTDATFDAFLCILEDSNDLFSTELCKHMRTDLFRSTNGKD